MLEAAKDMLKIMANTQNPRTEIMTHCKDGYLAEVDIRDLGMSNTREVRMIREHLVKCNHFRMRDIVILMMNFPLLSKLHSDMLNATANALIRQTVMENNDRHDLDREHLGTSVVERQLYIPGFVSAYFDLVADLIVELCAEAAQNATNLDMTTGAALRARVGMTPPEKIDLHKLIRDDQNRFYKMIAGEMMGCDALGTPGDMTSLANYRGRSQTRHGAQGSPTCGG